MGGIGESIRECYSVMKSCILVVVCVFFSLYFGTLFACGVHVFAENPGAISRYSCNARETL